MLQVAAGLIQRAASFRAGRDSADGIAFIASMWRLQAYKFELANSSALCAVLPVPAASSSIWRWHCNRSAMRKARTSSAMPGCASTAWRNSTQTVWLADAPVHPLQ